MTKTTEEKLIAVIRIHGRVGLDKNIKETLKRIKLDKKYSCIILKPNKEQAGMIEKVRDFVAFGEVTNETIKKVVEARGKSLKKDKKVDIKKVLEAISNGKKPSEAGIRDVFRMHPPRKGINAKLHFPKGVLGNNKDKINNLLLRML
mgnify:CR=1 FL=1